MSTATLHRMMTMFATGLALAGCSHANPPSSSPPPIASSCLTRQPPLMSVYRAALGTSVPVPEGWNADEYQGTAVTVISPPCAITHGPRFTVEHLAGIPPSVALANRCAPSSAAGSTSQALSPPPADGPTVIDGHAASYEYVCPPRTFIGPEWTVLVPGASGAGTWRLTYLGAGMRLGQGALAAEFTRLVKAFQVS